MVTGKLLQSQIHLGESARAFLKALTNQAINDLIDRATGFDRLKPSSQWRRFLKRSSPRFYSRMSKPSQPPIASTSIVSIIGTTIQIRRSGAGSLDIGPTILSTLDLLLPSWRNRNVERPGTRKAASRPNRFRCSRQKWATQIGGSLQGSFGDHARGPQLGRVLRNARRVTCPI